MKLGQEAKDKITGFSGTVVGKAEYLTGCTQYHLQPKSKENEFKEGHWFDETRIEIVGEGIEPASVQGETNGCDITPPRC